MIPFDYRCPISCEELYDDLFKGPIDMPDGAMDWLVPIYNHKTVAACAEKFGFENVKVRWGIFMGMA